jgi:hypothetical protein
LNKIEVRENSEIVVDFDDNLKTVSLKPSREAVLAGAEKVSCPSFDILPGWEPAS